MESIQEIIKSKQRAMLPSRLLRGAAILGDLWRSGVRCTSGGWGSTCSCSPRVDFCEAKFRWINLYCDLNGDGGAWILYNGGAFDVILAMTVRQFEATGVSALVQVPGSKSPIRIGRDGTVWQTIADLGALDSTADYDAALRTVLKIQQVTR